MSLRNATDRIAMVTATKDTLDVLNQYGIKMCAGGRADSYLGDLLMIYDRTDRDSRCHCMTFLDAYSRIKDFQSWFGNREVNMLELHTICRAIKEDRIDELLAECDRHSGETD